MAGEKHLRIQASGGYSGSGEPANEVWSFNLRLALVFGSIDNLGTFPSNWEVASDFRTQTESTYTIDNTWKADGPLTQEFDPVSYLIDQAEPALAAFISGFDFSARAQLRKIAVYPCDTSGNSIGGNFSVLTYTSGFPVGIGTNMLPLENSIAVSWQTERLGPRGKGRIYTPVPATSVLDTDGLCSTSKATLLAERAKDLLEGLSTTLYDSGLVRPVVTGPTAKPGIPAYTQYGTITQVRVGRVIDTQRRRRNKETEGYIIDTPSYP